MTLLGDMNCDGVVNGYDVTPFSLALSDPEAYAQQYPDCMIELGDVNGDGAINGLDLNAFVRLMSGNLMSARRYQYDEENRLTAVTEIDDTPLLEIEYDALGRRIASTEYDVPTDPCTGDAGPVTVRMRHIYSGLNTVAEYISCDAGENWGLGREFLWGNRFPEPLVMIDYTAAGALDVNEEEVLHYVRDALGSVVGLLDAGDPQASPDPIPAKMVERYDYDPYGKTYVDVWAGGSETWIRTTASAYGNPFGWTGQRYDAGVGMYHFPFRSYSPELGRWMQRDPLGYVQGMNLYAYAGSMAVSMGDPLGLMSVAPPPEGWHPPLLPPEEDDPDFVGPPVPPEPDPCGYNGGAIVDPEGAFGGGGGGSAGSETGGSRGGDAEGGATGGSGDGGTTTTPPPPGPEFPPAPPPIVPQPHRSGGGAAGGRTDSGKAGVAVALFSTTPNPADASSFAAGPDQFQVAAGAHGLPLGVGSAEEAVQVLRNLVESGETITDLYIFDHGDATTLQIGGESIDMSEPEGVASWAAIAESVDASGTIHLEGCEIAADGEAMSGAFFVQSLATLGGRCVEAWTGKASLPVGPLAPAQRLIMGPITHGGHRIRKCP